MKKYEEGLTDEQLDDQIKKVGSLIPKEDENLKYQLVIVEGHIFEIDRSVPKIVNYKGPADGIIITASIKQNGDWQNPVATVTGTIIKYGGGTVTSSSALAKVVSTGDTSPITNFPTTGGSYTIADISEDTDITITATDSEGHDPVTEVIKVRLVRDTTPPVLSNAKVKANRMKMKISVNATDSESGLKQITYKVEPNTVDKPTGELSSGQEVELTATEEREYTVTFTAEDNAGNVSKAEKKLTVMDAMSIEDVKKEVNEDNLKDYIGTKVNYRPEAGGTWRVFYYDKDNYFGDGIGTVYLKRDYVSNDTYLGDKRTYLPSDNGKLMKQMNPLWRDSKNGESIDVNNEHCVSWLCDPINWTSYKTEEVKYAIGGPSLEMFIKAYNAYYDAEVLKCIMDNENLGTRL